jgi:hypothetical protein
MVKRLILFGSALFGNGIIPLFGIGKNSIHVKDHATKGMLSVADNLSQVIFGARLQHNIATPVARY